MANKQKIKGAEALLLSLIAEGTDTIFGYPGGQVIPIYDHLYHHTDRLHHILTRHEQGAVHAAQGYARATGKVGVCLATSGPGATNLVTGIADAMLDSTPIICITGQVPAALLGTDAFQEADTISMTMPISKWNYQVTKASEIPRAIARAYYIARTGRPGPVVIDISKNAQVEEFDFSYKPCIYLRSYHPKPELDKQAVARAVEMLNASEKPLILVGQGVKLAGAERRLVELAEAAGAPMASTLMGISAVPSGHPLFVGNLGMHGNIAANEMTQQSDLILAVGMRFSDRVTGNAAKFAPNAKILQFDVDPAEIDKNVKTYASVIGDVKTILKKLNARLDPVNHDEWLAHIDRMKDMYPLRYDKNLLTGPYVVEQIYELTQGDAVITTEVGQHQMWAAQFYKYKHPRTFVTSGGLGTMGYGLGAALGAKMGCKDKVVINIAGDGCFRMNMNEIATATRYNIPVIQVVLNNHVLGMVRQWQTLFYGKRYSHTVLNDAVDFVKVAEGMGAKAYRVTSKDEFMPVLKEAIGLNIPVVIDCQIHCDDKVFPMVSPGAPIQDAFDENDLKI